MAHRLLLRLPALDIKPPQGPCLHAAHQQLARALREPQHLQRLQRRRRSVIRHLRPHPAAASAMIIGGLLLHPEIYRAAFAPPVAVEQREFAASGEAWEQCLLRRARRVAGDGEDVEGRGVAVEPVHLAARVVHGAGARSGHGEVFDGRAVDGRVPLARGGGVGVGAVHESVVVAGAEDDGGDEHPEEAEAGAGHGQQQRVAGEVAVERRVEVEGRRREEARAAAPGEEGVGDGEVELPLVERRRRQAGQEQPAPRGQGLAVAVEEEEPIGVGEEAGERGRREARGFGWVEDAGDEGGAVGLREVEVAGGGGG
ncbi:hypothetical protein BRADI_2g01724v3 [Brachypodium distachyon]|uniref:Uncharacterized protein n=1 Tax=Brachypodium distachyon TaxID=15368 RepID=A0A0Q3FTH0_BRADI|nr:hypothetical protein BRADI_2g01724v3 [Brachypodium distachyon]